MVSSAMINAITGRRNHALSRLVTLARATVRMREGGPVMGIARVAVADTDNRR